MRREPSISEQEAREIVERMGHREYRSERLRDELDRIVRTLGGRGMSASGLIENLVRLHLETYREDIGQWRKL